MTDDKTKLATVPTELTLRDMFAMAALNGLLSTDEGQAVEHWSNCEAAYELADRMLEARKPK